MVFPRGLDQLHHHSEARDVPLGEGEIPQVGTVVEHFLYLRGESDPEPLS